MPSSIQRRGERGDYRYIVRWREHSHDVEHSRTFDRKVNAEAFRAQVAADISRGTYIDPRRADRLFGDFATEWLALQSGRASSRDRQALMYATHIAPTFASTPVGVIRPTMVKQWLAGLKLAPSTRTSALRLLSAILTSAVNDQIIARNPVATVKAPKLDREPLRALTVHQVRTLADAAPERLHAAVVVAAATGLRQGELFGLTVDRIQFLRREITIDRQLITPNKGAPHFGPPKTDRGFRDVPTADHALEALSEHLRAFDPGRDGLVFTNSDGNPWRRSMAATAFRRMRDAAELDPTTAKGWHALRHHAASVMIAEGLGVTAVASTLGHTPAECLKTYAHWWPEDGEPIRAAMSRAWTDSAEEEATGVR